MADARPCPARSGSARGLVAGDADAAALGSYVYDKLMDGGRSVRCLVAVYPVAVRKLAGSFPEQRQRKRRWMGLAEAAAAVHEAELAAMIRNFAPAGPPQA